MDEPLEPVEATIPQDLEIDVVDDSPETEDVETLKSKLAESDKAKAQILARAKKAEAEVKELKTPRPNDTITNPVLSPEDVDVKILKAQGISDELIKNLKVIAKVNDISLLDAQADPVFLAMKDRKEADAKAAKARLGASKGSGSVKKEKDFKQSLSPDEHKELWKAKNR